MSIIDDWLRQWPNLTLTRDQRDTLEELIDEGGDDPSFYSADDADIEQEAFTAGAKAMQKNIMDLLEDATAPDNGIGLTSAVRCIVDAIGKLLIPEMPEEDETT